MILGRAIGLGYLQPGLGGHGGTRPGRVSTPGRSAVVDFCPVAVDGERDRGWVASTGVSHVLTRW